jgi:hypothetical protein
MPLSNLTFLIDTSSMNNRIIAAGQTSLRLLVEQLTGWTWSASSPTLATPAWLAADPATQKDDILDDWELQRRGFDQRRRRTARPERANHFTGGNPSSPHRLQTTSTSAVRRDGPPYEARQTGSSHRARLRHGARDSSRAIGITAAAYAYIDTPDETRKCSSIRAARCDWPKT